MLKESETWKSIKGYEGFYEVSSKGEVRSLDRKTVYRDGFRNYKGKILRPNNIKGYSQVTLQKNGKTQCFLVHRLVAEAFIPNPNSLPQVNHIDGNKSNNMASNLEWCTAKENMIHSVENYIRTDLKPVDMYLTTGEHVCTFPSIHNASKKTGIGRAHIAGCCNGKYGHRTAGGYVWRYHDRGCA